MSRPAIDRDARIYVAGHRGMVGSAIARRLEAGGYHNLVTRTRAELDLIDFAATEAFLAAEKPDYIFMAAARVGGIWANSAYPADFIRENLAVQLNLVEAAHRAGVQRLMFLGSSCIYPRDCPQPIREDYLLSGPLEPTNEPYAVAKIAGLKLCEAYNRQHGRQYVSVMPTNLYGPNDNYDGQTSHVFAALLRRAHEAKQNGERALTVWGAGAARREFLHVDDMADACVFLMERDYGGAMLNVGCGHDIAIADLARLMLETVGAQAALSFDASKPDGTPRKLLDVSRLTALGWTARIGIEEGARLAYRAFLAERTADR
ncbi:MAG TPA: GDP-L-fucose synthase [Caulobacteraceae bacterium]|nr:GDP-L-fucose synthase [Caulobacteraceae bacterium]